MESRQYNQLKKIDETSKSIDMYTYIQGQPNEARQAVILWFKAIGNHSALSPSNRMAQILHM